MWGLFDAIGDLADSVGDIADNLTVVVGNNTFEDVFTTLGETVGNGWETVGELADEATKDITIDLDYIFDDE